LHPDEERQWRRTLLKNAVDELRRAGSPMTAREIAEALIAGKDVPATRKQFIDLQAAVLAALRKRDGAMVVGKGMEIERGRQLRWPIV